MTALWMIAAATAIQTLVYILRDTRESRRIHNERTLLDNIATLRSDKEMFRTLYFELKREVERCSAPALTQEELKACKETNS